MIRIVSKRFGAANKAVLDVIGKFKEGKEINFENTVGIFENQVGRDSNLDIKLINLVDYLLAEPEVEPILMSRVVDLFDELKIKEESYFVKFKEMLLEGKLGENSLPVVLKGCAEDGNFDAKLQERAIEYLKTNEIEEEDLFEFVLSFNKLETNEERASILFDLVTARNRRFAAWFCSSVVAKNVKQSIDSAIVEMSQAKLTGETIRTFALLTGSSQYNLSTVEANLIEQAEFRDLNLSDLLLLLNKVSETPKWVGEKLNSYLAEHSNLSTDQLIESLYFMALAGKKEFNEEHSLLEQIITGMHRLNPKQLVCLAKTADLLNLSYSRIWIYLQLNIQQANLDLTDLDQIEPIFIKNKDKIFSEFLIFLDESRKKAEIKASWSRKI